MLLMQQQELSGGGGYPANAYVFRVKTDNPGVSSSNQYYIPTYAGGDFNYNVKTSDGHNISSITSDYTITFSTPGEYIIEITGVYSAHRNNNQHDKLKILEIIQFGNPDWKSAHFGASYYGCSNLTILPLDNDTGDFLNSLTITSASSLFRNSGVKRLPLNTSFPNITNFYWFCFGSKLDTDVCSALIINIEANNPRSNITIHFGNSKYNSSAITALNSLILRGWTVQTAGLE